MAIFYCLRFETPAIWRTKSPCLYPPGTGWPSYTPRHWVPFSSPPLLERLFCPFYNPTAWAAARNSSSTRTDAWIRLCGNVFTQLFHNNGFMRHTSYRDTSSIVACGHYLATAVLALSKYLTIVLINYLSRKPGHVTSWCQKYPHTLQYWYFVKGKAVPVLN
jgi:hypothetical protein